MAEETTLKHAMESLRMAHQAFRRISEEEARELESLRLRAIEAQLSAAPQVLAELRLRVMERAFDVLQLGRFANAIENHGWMNLFREWVDPLRQPDSQRQIGTFYEVLITRSSPIFRSFFFSYIWGHAAPMDQDPVPHYWLSGQGVFMDSGRTEPPVPAGTRPGHAGIVDFKGKSGRDQQYETPTGDADAKGSTPNA
jgi:hypothetical protein